MQPSFPSSHVSVLISHFSFFIFDLTDYTQIRMMVHQAGNYFNNAENFQQMTSTLIREAGSTEWEQLEVPYPPAGNSWTFSNSGYIILDDYAGIQSSPWGTDRAGTWPRTSAT